jgi:hypothetical protein
MQRLGLGSGGDNPSMSMPIFGSQFNPASMVLVDSLDILQKLMRYPHGVNDDEVLRIEAN